MIELILIFFISFIAGIIGSMTGIGGGVIISPYLSYLNYFPSQISATSLMSILSTSISSSYVYHRKNLIQGKIGLFLAITSIPGTFIGVYFSGILSINEFRYYFALILLGAAFYLLLKTKFQKENFVTDFITYSISAISKYKLALLVIISFIAGILSSSFGIGGGVIFVPCLIIILGFRMTHAAATSQFALLFTSVSGFILFSLYGKPQYYLGLILIIGSILGSIVGSNLAIRINSSVLQRVFSVVLIMISIKLILDSGNLHIDFL